jgi:hypothetical protein
MAVALYRHPSDTSWSGAVGRCLVSTGDGWFEVDCSPGAGGWRLRKPYFGPRAALTSIAGAPALAVRQQIDLPGWLEEGDQRPMLG